MEAMSSSMRIPTAATTHATKSVTVDDNFCPVIAYCDESDQLAQSLRKWEFVAGRGTAMKLASILYSLSLRERVG